MVFGGQFAKQKTKKNFDTFYLILQMMIFKNFQLFSIISKLSSKNFLKNCLEFFYVIKKLTENRMIQIEQIRK